MEKNLYTTKNAKETQALAEQFAAKLKPGDSILLEGELGSGKTTFVQGVSKKLKIKRRIISPTFVLVRTYQGMLGDSEINLYHIDLYRIHDLNTVVDLGLSEIFEDPKGIIFIEWGKKSGRTDFNWSINFEALSESTRSITINKNE